MPRLPTDDAAKTGSIWAPKDKHGAPRRWPSGAIRYRGKVIWPDGKRQDVAVLEAHCTDEDAARAYVKQVQKELDANGAMLLETASRTPVTDTAGADDWYDAWEKSRKAKGLTSTRDNRSHYAFHVRPALGGKHVRDWTADDMRQLVHVLDGKVRADAINWKYALNVWGTATRMARDAISSKVDSLRVRTIDPCLGVEGPDRGQQKAKQFLFPSEFLEFVSCADVPLKWRLAVTLAVYLYPRDGELRVLRWRDVDLEHGTVHIHHAWDRRSRKEKSTKTKRVRQFNIEPALVPLLEAMKGMPGDLVIELASERAMARALRRWLKKASGDRVELHETTSSSKGITFHDLRATGCTWMAVRGDDPLKIMQRAGHERFETTQIYIRTAEAIRGGFGDAFPSLPASLFECLQQVSTSHLSARNHSGVDGTRTRWRKRRKAAENPALPMSVRLTPFHQPTRNVPIRDVWRPVRARSSNAWPNSRRPSRASRGRSEGCRTTRFRCSSRSGLRCAPNCAH